MKVFLVFMMLTAYSVGYSQSQDSLLIQLPAFEPIGDNGQYVGIDKSRDFSKNNKFVVDGKFVTSKVFLDLLDNNDDYSFVIQVDSIKNEKVAILKKN